MIRPVILVTSAASSLRNCRTHFIGPTFLKKASCRKDHSRSGLTQIEFAQFTRGAPRVGDIIIGGPYNAKGIGDTQLPPDFICRPLSDKNDKEETACAAKTSIHHCT